MSTYDDEIRKLAEATLEHHKAATPGPWEYNTAAIETYCTKEP